jgi:hypothetical protein
VTNVGISKFHAEFLQRKKTDGKRDCARLNRKLQPRLVKREMPLEIAYSREQHKQRRPELLSHILADLNQLKGVRILSAVEYEVVLDEKPTGRSNDPERVNTGIPMLRMKAEIYAHDRKKNGAEPDNPNDGPSRRATP